MNEKLLKKLRCTNCLVVGNLQTLMGHLFCPACKTQFPIVEGRFPDFLTPEDRRVLETEIAFWSHHFPGSEIYRDESTESYQGWADLFGLTGSEEIIELGCGSGALLSTLPGSLRVGLEPVESLLHPSKDFEGILGNAVHLPFGDATFDVVYFKHSLHHVTDKEKAFREAARITRPGGRFFIMEPNASHPYRRLISQPDSILRKRRIIVKFISPVETFQPAEEPIEWAKNCGLVLKKLEYRESHYDHLSFKQLLQRIYRIVTVPFLPARLRFPNYFIAFHKS